MDMPTMPPPPRPALVLNISLPMVKGGKIIPQPLWMESQLKDYAQQYAQQFERAAASLALDRAELAAQVEQARTPVAWRYWKDKLSYWEYSDVPLQFPAVPAGTKMEPLYLGPNGLVTWRQQHDGTKQATEATGTLPEAPAVGSQVDLVLGPAVPQEVMTYLHAYGDSRADDDGMSGVRISEAILALRRWSAAVQAAERKRWAEACDANAKIKREWYAKTESDDDRGAAEMAEWLANCIRRA